MTRREWFTSLAVAAAARRGGGPPRASARTAPAGTLALERFQPRSMLEVPATAVPRARVPAIDFHTHLGYSTVSTNGVPQGDATTFLAAPRDLLPVMDRANVRMMVNLTGGVGRGLQQSLERYQRPHPDRFLTFAEPRWGRAADPTYARDQAADIERAHRLGARGVKVLKTLGLYLRERVTFERLVPIDDPRFDPMWEACGGLKMPVALHIGDPAAFFLPIDRFNERFEELNEHPDWSFHGRDFPSLRALLDARNRVLARHPATTFVALHFGNHAENLADVAACLDTYPNMYVETGARIAELGRQPRTARRFFDRYQDRILFGTDAVPHGVETPQQIFGDALYGIYFRFLETEDEYFDYAPAATPPQGRWRIYGLGLPETILRKVYHDNAARLLGLST